MGHFFVYILKAALCLTLLYLPFIWLLRNETLARFNRIVLLCIMTASFLLPLCHLSWPATQETPAAYIHTVQAVEQMADVRLVYENGSTNAPAFDYRSLILLIYIIGIAVCTVYKLADLVRMLRFIPKGCLWTLEENGLHIYCHIRPVAPFSWMNRVVISEQDYTEHGETILMHERAHAKLGHTWDVLMVTVAEILLWFNPFIWLLADDLQAIHEYEADESVLRSGADAHSYQLLMIRKAAGSVSYAFANSFNHSLTKKRITMMLQKKSSKWTRAKVLYVLPVAAISLCAFATPEFISGTEPFSDAKVSKSNPSLQASAPEVVIVAYRPHPQEAIKTDSTTTPADDGVTVFFIDRKQASEKEFLTALENDKDHRYSVYVIKDNPESVKSLFNVEADHAMFLVSNAVSDEEGAVYLDADKGQGYMEIKEKAAKSMLDENKAFFLNGVQVSREDIKKIKTEDIANLWVIENPELIKKHVGDIGATALVFISTQKK